jgi:RNA polymerase sigma-70 factor, ECF subfamily
MGPELRNAYERCQRRYPTIDLPFAEFAARVEEVLRATQAPSLHEEDLYLALACARGDRLAWEYFTDEMMPSLKRFALQACRNVAEAEDLTQDLIRSLMSDSRKIRGYDGRGALLSWLRVAISRAAIDRFRRARREVPLEEGAEARDEDPRLSVPPEAGRTLDEGWGAMLVGILAEEIRGLPARERLLLGMYYLDGVPLKTIAAHFGVHESTASRWLEGLRQQLRKRLERLFKERHGMRAAEVRALWENAARQPDERIRDAVGSTGTVSASGVTPGRDTGGK